MENETASQTDEPRESATKYLTSLLNKTLRIQIGDRRVFVGQMKCTDKDHNIILQNAHEYRETPLDAANSPSAHQMVGSVKQVNSRYVGLIVVPGEHIKTIELEEFDKSLII